MKNSKADKKRFANSNHESNELKFLKNFTQYIFLGHKKFPANPISYNPKIRHSIQTQNNF
jgi:hypothetical protein